jgi:hypothetical protein
MQTLKWKAGDISFDINGKSKFITQDEKVAQDIAYYVLAGLTADKPRSRHAAQQSISDAIQKLRAVQATRTDLSPRETVNEIEELTIVPSVTSPTTSYYFYLVVSTDAGDLVSKIFDPEERTDLSHLLPSQGV